MEPSTAGSKRQSRPSRKLLDPSNAAEQEVASHRWTTTLSASSNSQHRQELVSPVTGEKRDATRAFAGPSEGTNRGSSSTPTAEGTQPKPRKVARTGSASLPSELGEDSAESVPGSSVQESTAAGSGAGAAAGSSQHKEPAAAARKSRARSFEFDPDNEVDDHGFLKDVEVIDVDEAPAARREDKSRDVDNFFSSSYTEDKKKWRKCKLCSKKKVNSRLVAEISTLRRHLQSSHLDAYYTWTKANEFDSMLPKDTKARREKQKQQEQSRLDAHLVEIQPPECIVKYTDALYREAAVEWLLATDQPLRALEHPAFKNMIDVAARATNGVKIPNRKQTRCEIINLFKRNMTQLRTKLNSDAVKGTVNLTCDAWQASNTDGYFAVTGHWIEETAAGVWSSQNALLGFVRLNNAHNGVRLGQALFKVVQRVGVEHKIGYITCDNAKNNGTMLAHFSQRIEEATGKPYDYKERYVWCLAHIINLATQAVIDAYSKTLHYDPISPELELAINHNDARRDVVGLVRAISVKERSSAKRKELFKQLQLRKGSDKTYQLLLDSPTRWSSTYVMLDRAEHCKEIVDQFVYEIGSREKDRERRQKLLDLQLSDDEWACVKTCLDLLGHADKAQQAFSAEEGPTLHHGLPALEALHKSWSARLDKPKYTEFRTAIRAGLDKVEDYYQKTSDSDIYTFAMLLDPSQKARHLDKYWGKELRQEAVDRAEKIYKSRYLELTAKSDASLATAQHGSATSAQREQHRVLRRTLSDDDDTDSEESGARNTSSSTAAATRLSAKSPADPWRQDFYGYLNSPDDLAGRSVVQWWGMNASRYPVWGSLAQDYLSVMASSVSSERAFSSAGITISKCRNRLKGDIVEALQALKCMYRRDLLFRDAPEVASETLSDEEEDDSLGGGGGDLTDEVGWDNLLDDLEDDEVLDDDNAIHL